LAKTFAVAKSQIIIQSGFHSRKKSLFKALKNYLIILTICGKL